MRRFIALLDVKNLLRAVTWDRRSRDLDLQDPGLTLLRSALTSPASAAELSGEDDAVALFRTSSAGHSSAVRRLWRPALLSSVVTTKLLTAFAAGAVGLGGAATVAYTGTLPDTLQDVAHDTIGAPAAHPSAKPTRTPVGPDATGPAAYGLCQAFDKERTHGKAAEKSVAFRNLAEAAGGADKIAGYCATVPKPSDSPEATETESPAAHPTGKPDVLPNGKQRPNGKPAELPAHPTGSPEGVPGS